MAKKSTEAVSEEVLEAVKEKPVKKGDDYADNAIKKIDSIIKFIAFVVGLGILALFVAVAAVIFFLDSSFYLVAVGVLVLGVVISLITLFLIYGLGHIITQNNEILKRLK